MRETQGRVRKLVGDATSTAMFVAHRSVLWNTEVAHQTRLGRVMRVPRRGSQQAALSALADVGLDRCASDPVGELSTGDRLRVALARMLARQPAALVLRDVDTALAAEEAASVLGTVRRVVRSHRLVAVVSLTSLELGRQYADRVLLLTDGALIADRRGLGARPSPAWELEDVAR
jgi:ABC-type phosphate/phosphonate transport system ATPase subunit